MNTRSDLLQTLDDTPIGAAHWHLLGVVGIGLLIDSFDIFVASGISSALLHDGFAEIDELGRLSAAMALGLAIGAFAGGFLGDRFGRRRTILAGAMLVVVGSLASLIAPNINALLPSRLITAVGLGIENVLAYGILIEFLPARARGTWMTALALLATCAAPLSLLATYFVAPQMGGWRLLFGIVATLSFFSLLLRLSLPESARWLAARGRIQEANAIAARFSLEVESPPKAATAAPDFSAATLPRHEVMLRLCVATMLNIGLVTATFGFLSWLPTFFAAEGRTLSSALLKSTLITLGAPFGVLLGLSVADRFERKWTTVIAALATSLLGIVYALGPASMMAPLGFLVVVAIYSFGAIGVTTYMPELFPTSIRMRAIGLAIGIGRLFAIAAPAATVLVYEHSRQTGVALSLAAILAVVAGVVARFGVRTNAKELDAI